MSAPVSTLDEWLSSRTPAPPPALGARMREVLRDDLAADATEAHARLLAAGEGLLRALVVQGAEDRGRALDLLVADALVTYAFEAAADAPVQLDSLTDCAMQRLSSVVDGQWSTVNSQELNDPRR